MNSHHQPSNPEPATPVSTVKAADAEPQAHPGRWLALAVLVCAVLLVGIDATVLGLATPFLGEDLRPSGTQL
ncbi:hypothetical protein GL263_11895, partial [Streptomyces durbertensis]|nr:hypothetical protein [Streptomyces durbertensis]